MVVFPIRIYSESDLESDPELTNSDDFLFRAQLGVGSFTPGATLSRARSKKAHPEKTKIHQLFQGSNPLNLILSMNHQGLLLSFGELLLTNVFQLYNHDSTRKA